MSDDFSPIGGTAKPAIVTWTDANGNESATFVPFPYSGQPATDEVGFGEGGYGAGGYDSPAIPASTAPTVQWSAYTTK